MHARLYGASLALLLMPAVGSAQSFPSKSIRVIVPYAPGGSTDVVLRTLAPRLTEEFGQSVVVDNRPGGGSTIGLDLAAKSPPDGHTWGIPNITFGANPSMIKQMPFDSEKDFVPVSQLSVVTMVLSVHPSVPARSVKDLIALATSRPGDLNFGSAGNASANHLATALFMQRTGVNLVHVPYKGGGPAVISLLGGETSILFATIPSAIQHIQAGKLRGLAVTTLTPVAAAPELPTLDASGVPGFDLSAWDGLWAPAGTPRPIVDKLNAALRVALNDPQTRERMLVLGAETVPGTPEDLARLVATELPRWANAVRQTGAKID